jgi:YVTN family beta-propeller protein
MLPIDVFRVHLRFAKQPAVIGAALAIFTILSLLVSVSTAGAKATTAPKAYIGLFGDDAVAVFDTSSDEVVSTIPVPAGPHGIVITPNNRWAYVSSDGASTVSIIDTITDTVVGSVEVGQTPHGLAMTPDGSQVLVAGFGTNVVNAIDTTTNQIVWSIPVASPHNIAVSPDGQMAYVASQDPASPTLTILSLPDHAIADTVPLTNIPRALTFKPDGSQLWFTEAGLDDVQVLDTASNDIVSTISVGASPHYPAFTPDGSLGMVVSQGTGELWLLDPDSLTSIDTVTVGSMPHWIAVSADGQIGYVTNETSNNLSIVDLTTASITDTIAVGNAPRQIVVQTSMAPGTPAPQATPPAEATTTAPGPSQGTPGVGIREFAFGPATVTIAAGQSLTWTNMDPVQHTTTSDSPNWDSGPLAPGATFSMTFDSPGTYTYHCNIHPFMHGSVIVTG